MTGAPNGRRLSEMQLEELHAELRATIEREQEQVNGTRRMITILDMALATSCSNEPPEMHDGLMRACVAIWDRVRGLCGHLADSDKPLPNLEPDPCAKCGRYYVEE